jgi:hypothetical protein
VRERLKEPKINDTNLKLDLVPTHFPCFSLPSLECGIDMYMDGYKN